MTTATVCVCFDFDAVSVWLHSYGELSSPTKLSRGTYGAEVAVPRLIDLLDRLDVPATWFTPGHTIESFPDACGTIVDNGHDVQNHGWKHTNPAEYENAASERADIERAIDAIRDLTGSGPEGYRSPSWDFSPNTLSILQDLGFDWDSSLMGHDFEPYLLRETPPVDPDAPFEVGEETSILEFPVSWHRDDWPPFQYVLDWDQEGGAPDEKQVFDMWREQFDWMYDHVENGVYTLTMHPQVIGQPPRLGYLEALLAHFRSKPGTRFELMNDVASQWQ